MACLFITVRGGVFYKMGEDKKPYSRNDWVRVILCGLILGGILGYNLYCVRCYVIGMELLLPVIMLHRVYYL